MAQKEAKLEDKKMFKSYPVLLMYKNDKSIKTLAIGEKAKEMGLYSVHVQFELPAARIFMSHSPLFNVILDRPMPVRILVRKWFVAFDIFIDQTVSSEKPNYKVLGFNDDNTVVFAEGNIEIPENGDVFVYAILTPRYVISIKISSTDTVITITKR